MARGPFISLDGLDGSGKSTQCRLLAGWLRGQGYTVTECVDPGGTAVGEILRQVLLEHRGEIAPPCEALLFMASRAQLTAEVIRPALEAGQGVVADRYTLANIVYQGYAQGLDTDLLREVGLLATGGLEPDLTLVLDLPIETALARRRGPGDRIERRDHAYHARVRGGFLAEARRRPAHLRIMDATQPVAVVQECIVREVARVLAGHRGP